MERQQHEQLRLRVWAAMHDYYWDMSKLRGWYIRLSANTGDFADIVSGMQKYPDMPRVRVSP